MGKRTTSAAKKARKVSFTPTERDIAMMRAVARHRLLRSRSHLVPLSGGSLNVLRRLQKLTAHDYLYRLTRRRHQEAVYAIGDKGSDLLKKLFGTPRPKVEWKAQNKTLTEPHIKHTLLIADVLVRVELACRQLSDVRYLSAEAIIEQGASARVKERLRMVDGHPLKWLVRVRDGEWQGEASIEPDGLFGIERSGKTNFFFLEADRGTMSVIPERPRLDRASIFKKMLQYWASWQKDARGHNLTARHFGLSDVRTLFVLATGARGNVRLERCLKANQHFYDGAGTGLFLFAKREALVEAPDILSAPLLAGTGAPRTLL